eukprot:2086628-Pyramimonas_sp.AAC.1
MRFSAFPTTIQKERVSWVVEISASGKLTARVPGRRTTAQGRRRPRRSGQAGPALLRPTCQWQP